METNRTVVLEVEKLLKRIRRLEKSITFINECKKSYKIPIFCRIGKNSRRKLLQSNVSSKKIKNMGRKKLFTEKKKLRTKMDNLQFDVNS